jgi:2-polyprenyl-3-methyl-5-hydroxy-6-metoxy-1,4-benzoquinol methylase
MLTQDDTLDRYSQSWFEQEYLPSYGIDPQNPSLTHLAARYNEELGPANLFRQTNRLLDVGAGAGLFLASARAAGWDVEGVEIAGYGPVYAQKHFDLHIVHGTLHDAQFPDDHFDIVMLQDTIEHVSDPLELLTEVCRVLRPGGGVILSTPNVDSLVRRVLAHAGHLSARVNMFIYSIHGHSCGCSTQPVLRHFDLKQAERCIRTLFMERKQQSFERCKSWYNKQPARRSGRCFTNYRLVMR